MKSLRDLFLENKNINSKEYECFIKDMLRPLGFKSINQMNANQKKLFQKKLDKAWNDRQKMHTKD